MTKRSRRKRDGKNIVQRRPAETATGVAGAIAGLICAIFSIEDPDVLIYLMVVIGFVPAAITWIVAQVRGE